MELNGKVTNPGEMRTLITIQRRVTTPGVGGFTVQSWDDIATVWSKWVNVHGQEALQAAILQASGVATVTIRYRVGVDTSCAVLKGEERYEIISMDNIRDHNEYIELKVKKAMAG